MSKVRAIFAFCLLAFLATPPALAQPQSEAGDSMAARLSAERGGDVETGSFSAGENLTFTLEPYGDKYLLRFADSPESYVLSVERVFLGGRILRYDTGVTAIRVSVWGGMTLYTAGAPNGLPATRVSEELPAPRPAVDRDDFVAALSDEEKHLAYTLGLHIRFSAEPGILNSKADKGLAFDALVSTAAGIEKLVSVPGGRAAMSKKFDTVRIVENPRPGVALVGKTLVVSFSPNAGQAGRASSREVAVQLGKMLQIAEAG